jgi:monofunctional biosynthetic peptidoglycan transglycosylase
MQTAKNLFLWPGRSWLRKGIEAYLTVMIELLWPKQRIMEVYLNIAEWGHGIYGVEAAAQTYFGKDASKLTRREAALLAAVLPNPREWQANPPGSYVSERASVIAVRIDQLGELLDCVRAGGR